MKKLQIFLALFLTCSLTFNLSAQASWRLLSTTGTTGQVYSHTPYNLQAIKGGAILAFKKKPVGMINLGWNTAGHPLSIFQIVKEGGGPLLCGDKVALFNDRGNYIFYKTRPHGINLMFSNDATPIYEWEIRNASNIKGSPILLNEPIALYNTVEKDFMRKCTRPGFAVDLAWLKDCPNGYRLPGALADTEWNNKTRQEVIAYLIKISIETL